MKRLVEKTLLEREEHLDDEYFMANEMFSIAHVKP